MRVLARRPVVLGLANGLTGALVGVAALGFSAFATVATLLTWVMSNATSAGERLASASDIAAFDLVDAIGAWAGGAALDGLGLGAVNCTATFFRAAIIVALVAVRPITPRKANS